MGGGGDRKGGWCGVVFVLVSGGEGGLEARENFLLLEALEQPHVVELGYRGEEPVGGY